MNRQEPTTYLFVYQRNFDDPVYQEVHIENVENLWMKAKYKSTDSLEHTMNCSFHGFMSLYSETNSTAKT